MKTNLHTCPTPRQAIVSLVKSLPRPNLRQLLTALIIFSRWGWAEAKDYVMHLEYQQDMDGAWLGELAQ